MPASPWERSEPGMTEVVANTLPVEYEIAGYRIKRVIGRGGFGITYEGYSPITRKQVVIKEFYPVGIASRSGTTVIIHVDDEEEREVYLKALAKFQETTTILCGIRHPNVVDVQHYVPATFTGYMIMEYLDGTSLED